MGDRFIEGTATRSLIGPERLHGFRRVVASGDQRCATDIARVGHCRAVEDQVVIHITLQAQAAVEDALLNHCIGYLNQKHSVDIVALQKERRLPAAFYCLQLWDLVSDQYVTHNVAMHKYIIMGVQGSGKGTQAKLLKESLDLVHHPSPDSDPVNYSTAL
jgi:hypothetical protein